MRVVQAAVFGGPDVLVATEAPDLAPAANEVVIDVAAADVLFLDTIIRSGRGRDFFDVAPPYVPGGGVAGMVSAVGAGVDTAWVGRRVIARTGVEGGYAQRAVVDGSVLTVVPPGLSLLDAAALVHDGVTAVALTEPAGLTPGKWVLVVGAAGGLGILLVQAAAASGASVIAAARTRPKLDVARDRGARIVVDYADPDWVKQVHEAIGGAGVDVVFDGVGGALGRAAFDLVAIGGWFSGHGNPSGEFSAIEPRSAADREVTLRDITDVQHSPDEVRRLTEGALAASVGGRLTPVVGQTYSLDRADEAHSAIEARAGIGKTLLLT